jgi:hypothetical protein
MVSILSDLAIALAAKPALRVRRACHERR